MVLLITCDCRFIWCVVAAWQGGLRFHWEVDMLFHCFARDDAMCLCGVKV